MPNHDCCSFFQKLLNFNPHRRISAIEALNHDYFKDLAVENVRTTLESVRTTCSLSPTSTSDSSIDSRSNTPVSK